MEFRRISTMCWQDHLRQTLSKLNASGKPLRVAVVGLGHELYGDDAVGTHIVRELRTRWVDSPNLLLLETGPAPENYSGALRRFHPHFVLILDAALLGEEPGEAHCVSWQDADGLSLSSHSLPISVFANYLSRELACEVALLGIQPAEMGFASGLSHSASTAVDGIARSLNELFSTFAVVNGFEKVDYR
jgi:hydrogenase 3 maturation protease